MSMHGERSNPALSRLEPPSRPQSPHTEFANGYSLGLIGGVRSWVSASNEDVTISDGRGWTGVDGCRCARGKLPADQWRSPKRPRTTKKH